MPEFNLSRFIGILAQFAVFICFIVGIWDAISTMPYSYDRWAQDSLTLIRGVMWMLGGVGLQVLVVALNHNYRQR